MKLRQPISIAERFLEPIDPKSSPVGVCRSCGYVQSGWCALANPRFVAGQCLNCYAKEGKQVRAA